MEPYALPSSPLSDTAIFNGSAITAGTSWQTWTKPAGKAYASILMIGAGGGGGSGAIGADGAAAGGGGGGSGGMTLLEIPLSFLPPRLYISVAAAKTGGAIASYVSTQPNTTSAHVVGIALGGNNGGNGSTTVAGSGGTGGAVGSASTMPIGWPFVKQVLVGQAGATGSLNTQGVGVTFPTTGLKVTGGTGGGGLSGAGGPMTVPTGFPSIIQVGAGSTSIPPANGSHGFKLDATIYGLCFYGGLGSGSTSSTATGAGLVQASGGNGAIGSGGGGMGAALTGSTAGKLSYGGAGLVIITCF